MAPLISYIYSIPYLILFGVLLFCYANEQRYFYFFSIRTVRILALFCLIFFFGFQCFVWNDWVNYYPYYEHLPDNIQQLFETKIDFPYFRVYNQNFEIGFVLYSFFIKQLGLDYFGWVFINSLIDFVVLYVVFRRYSCSIILSFIAFLIFDGLSFEFNLFRNSKAILLFLLSIPYGIKRQFYIFLVLNCIGATFHLSSLLYIPCYCFIFQEIRLKWMWIIFVLSIIIFIAGAVFITDSISHMLNLFPIGIETAAEKLENYSTNHLKTVAIFSWTFLLRIVLMLCVLLNYRKLRDQSERNLVFMNALLLYVAAANIFFSMGVLYVRITALFSFAAWIMVVNTIYLSTIHARRFIIILFLLVVGVKLTRETSQIILAYQNVFWSNTDYGQNKRRWIVDYGRFVNLR